MTGRSVKTILGGGYNLRDTFRINMDINNF